MGTSRDTLRRGAIAGALGLVVVGALTAWIAERPNPSRPGLEGIGEPGDADAIVPWCADGLEAIEGGGCLRAPPGKTRALIVYLHGLYEKDAPAEELDRQRRLAERAASRGFAVLALRGRIGECRGAVYEDWFCWPSNEANAADAEAFVARWKRALEETDARVGPSPRYVVGFSNGGYFASILASRALFAAKAFAIAHAGPVAPMRAAGARPPIVLLDADDDPSQPEMLRLDGDLTLDRWPHDIVERDGGHGLTDSDIDAALTFFTRTVREGVPLEPPIGRRTPRPRAPEETAEAAPSVAAEPPDAAASGVDREDATPPGEEPTAPGDEED